MRPRTDFDDQIRSLCSSRRVDRWTISSKGMSNGVSRASMIVCNLCQEMKASSWRSRRTSSHMTQSEWTVKGFFIARGLSKIYLESLGVIKQVIDLEKRSSHSSPSSGFTIFGGCGTYWGLLSCRTWRSQKLSITILTLFESSNPKLPSELPLAAFYNLHELLKFV